MNHRKKQRECPNPLFLKWLEEWRDEAKEKNSKLQYTYGKAATALKKYPLPLSCGKDAMILDNIGEMIARRLDEAMAKYIASNKQEWLGYQRYLPSRTHVVCLLKRHQVFLPRAQHSLGREECSRVTAPAATHANTPLTYPPSTLLGALYLSMVDIAVPPPTLCMPSNAKPATKSPSEKEDVVKLIDSGNVCAQLGTPPIFLLKATLHLCIIASVTWWFQWFILV